MNRTDPGAHPASRTRIYAFVAILAGALLGLIATAQPWWLVRHASGETPLSGTVTSGGLSQALPAVLLAGWLLALTLGSKGRRVLGVLLALIGVGCAVTGVLGAPPAEQLVTTTVQQASLGGEHTLTRGAWGWVFAVAGALAAAGALLMVLRAASWPARTRRFDRAPDPEGLDDEDPAAIWKTLDRGADPTVAEDRSPDPTPISSPARGGERMGDNSTPPSHQSRGTHPS
ncbi:Trp biosynthesis-associated membrane protein [Propionibacteriaceae bacterium Y1700]|uniref:Trp biosynthesis-associated membrane protein n=1 Tax=Microlunatus sp. Y1700 TaxID=3418487 RepID=UPI003DA727E5